MIFPRRISGALRGPIVLIAVLVGVLAAVGVWASHVISDSSSADVSGKAGGSKATTVAGPLAVAARSGPSYWGGTIFNSQGQAPWQMSAASAFARVAGKKVSLISWGSDFYSKQFCAGYCDFQTANFDAVRSYGAVPVFSWAPTFSTRKVDRKIANGSQDAYITQWAKAAKAWGHPFFLRFAWEMNGQWFPWGIGSNGLKNTPAEYRAMWRHVYNIFQRVGARNATWVWCPNWSSPPYTYTPVSNLWPGKRYVNWTCLDGYNADDPWLSFDRIYRSSYQTLMKIAPDKPVMFGELSSTERGGSKAQWIRNMFSLLPKRYPSVRAIIWFEGKFIGPGGRQDWVVESSRSSKRAFQAGIRERRYRSNVFSGLSGNPIRPPR